MDCPVCNHKGIPDSLHKCPNCHSDITAFKNIHRLNQDIKTKRNIIMAMGFALVLLVVFLAYMFLFSDGFSGRYTRMEIQAKNNEILELRKQNTELQQTLFDLQQHGDTSGNAGDEFRKVIPSSKTTEGTAQQERRRPAATVDRISTGSQPADGSQQQATDAKPKVTYYRIKAGETLYSVAKREYGDGNKYRKIMKDNNIEDPSDVKVGMRLKIIKE